MARTDAIELFALSMKVVDVREDASTGVFRVTTIGVETETPVAPAAGLTVDTVGVVPDAVVKIQV